MRVALELQPCCWSRSGIGTFVYETARRLECNDRIEFYGNIFSPILKKINMNDLSEIKIPIRYHKFLSYGIYRRIWNVFPLDYQKLFTPNVDVSVFFNFIVPPNISGRVITTVHDLTFIRYPETMKVSNYKHISKGLRRSLDRSDVIISVSEFTKAELCNLMGVPEEKVKVVYSAPSIHENRCIKYLDTAQKYRIQGEYILFVSTIEPRKNISRLLKAYDYLKQTKKIPHQLVLAGGKGWADDGILRDLSDLKSAQDVIITGFVTEEEKRVLYENASVFVYPSIYEGFGLPPLEAMLLGCPVVCANAASIPEIVGNAALMVDPFSIESIADGIYEVLDNNQIRNSLIEKGVIQAKKYNWDKTVKGLVSVIEQCVNV